MSEPSSGGSLFSPYPFLGLVCDLTSAMSRSLATLMLTAALLPLMLFFFFDFISQCYMSFL